MALEIMSPAGSFESVVAAVRSGADAVYFGAGDFNARRNANHKINLDAIINKCIKHTYGIICAIGTTFYNKTKHEESSFLLKCKNIITLVL